MFYKDKTQIKKLEPRALKGVLLGFYTPNSYKILDLRTKKVIYSRDVTILEGEFFSFNIKEKYTPYTSIRPNSSIEDRTIVEPIRQQPIRSIRLIEPNSSIELLDNNPIDTIEELPKASMPKVVIPSKPKDYLSDFTLYNIEDIILSCIQGDLEPKNIKEAISSLDKSS